MQVKSPFLTQPNYFFKMHGTGNDFILVNGLGQNSLQKDQAVSLASKLCHRKFGIGADGLLIVRQVNGVYKMQVVNSDGSLPNMCGNGLRCFVSLLYHLKLIPQSYDVLTDDGIKSVKIHDLQKENSMQNTKYLVTLKIGRGEKIQEFQNEKYEKLYLTTVGVPHLIIFLTSHQFDETNFQLQGKKIQKRFDANINFCRLDSNDSMTIKTYQRGAGLTYSCGTGVSSSVYVAVKKQMISAQTVKVNTDGGQIDIKVTEEPDIIMNGPAEIICQGTFQR